MLDGREFVRTCAAILSRRDGRLVNFCDTYQGECMYTLYSVDVLVFGQLDIYIGVGKKPLV